MTKRPRQASVLFRHSCFVIRHFLVGALVLLFAARVFAAEVIPPAPDKYFNDYAHVVSSNVAHELNEKLAQFERETSNQIVVAIYQKMQSDSSIDDYAVRVARTWKVGQKERSNGIVLLVFVQDHKLFIPTGAGIQGAVPDMICKRIIDDEITPRFKRNDFAGGLTAGVNALMAATRGEYKGTGRTHKESQGGGQGGWLPLIFLFVVIFVVVSNLRKRTATYYGSTGRHNWSSGWYIGSGGSSGGWSSGSGGGGGGGDSGFSGGGGGFDGGGAGGSW